MKCSFGITDFLEEIPSLSHSVVFLYFFALIAEEGFLISSCYSVNSKKFLEAGVLFLHILWILSLSLRRKHMSTLQSHSDLSWLSPTLLLSGTLYMMSINLLITKVTFGSWILTVIIYPPSTIAPGRKNIEKMWTKEWQSQFSKLLQWILFSDLCKAIMGERVKLWCIGFNSLCNF